MKNNSFKNKSMKTLADLKRDLTIGRKIVMTFNRLSGNKRIDRMISVMYVIYTILY